MIKLVVFDAAGVLFPNNSVVAADLTRRFGMTAAEQRPFWQGLYQQYTVGAIDTPRFFQRFAAMFRLSPQAVTTECFTTSFLAALEPIPGIERLLQDLQVRPVTVAMLSDTTPIFAVARQALGFSNYFDHLFLSFELGCKKPDRRAYSAVQSYYDCAPTDILFIDDVAPNVAGAQAAGWQAVQFRTAKQLREELQQAGVLQ